MEFQHDVLPYFSSYKVKVDRDFEVSLEIKNNDFILSL